MKKIIILPLLALLLALLLVSAQCSLNITAEVPSLVYSDTFDYNYNQGWNLQYGLNFQAYMDNENLRMNLSSNVDEGFLWVPLSNWNSLSDTYTIQVDVRVDNTYGNTALILFNYVDNLTHDCFQVDTLGYWRLTRFTNGIETFNSNWNHDLFSSNFDNKVVISQHDNRIDLNFNGMSSETFYLPSRNESISVQLGINASGGGTVWYDNLYLTRLSY